jgi:hypothetical protein
MDEEFIPSDEQTIINKATPEYNNLSAFINKSKFLTKRKSKYTIIIDQLAKKNYHFQFRKYCDGSFLKEGEIENVKNHPMDIFFNHLEKCRIKNKYDLHYSERQYFTVTDNISHYYDPIKDSAEAEGDETMPLEKDDNVNHSCIELDFDMYLDEEVKFTEAKIYYPLTTKICSLLFRILDPESSKTKDQDVLEKDENKTIVKFYVAILTKPPRKVKHPTYGECHKNSFHMRFFVKVRKEVKRFLLFQIIEKGILQEVFKDIKIKNDIKKNVIDENCCGYPAMIYGCMKSGGTGLHQLEKLYHITYQKNAPLIIKPCIDFEPQVIKIAEKTRVGRGEHIKNTQIYEYRYNLCYELSLNFENPGGLIKKKIFEPNKDINIIINVDKELLDKGVPIGADDEIERRIGSIAAQDYEAKWIRDVLSLLDMKRLRDYDTWIRIIMAIARENQSYIDIAVWISRKVPSKFKGNRTVGKIKQLFEDTRINPNGKDGKPVTFRTIEFWAKEDNSRAFSELSNENAVNVLRKEVLKFSGILAEGQVGIALRKMFSYKYKTSKIPSGKSYKDVWREFVFPHDVTPDHELEVWKWKKVEGEPNGLMKYIEDVVPEILQSIRNYLKNEMDKRIANDTADEQWKKYIVRVMEGIQDTRHKCFQMKFKRDIINECSMRFYVDGLEKLMDKNVPDYIGVGNGVLQLFPEVKLINSYHDFPISRHMNACYYKYDPEDPYIKRLETELRRVFANDEDAYRYNMMFLASQLDGNQKQPTFLIWVGGGSNGKTILTEFQLWTFGQAVEGGTGYGYKIPIMWFYEGSKTGPDAAAGPLENTRAGISAEGNETPQPLSFAKIKEMLSEEISTNDKYAMQKMIDYKGNVATATNWVPAIRDNDYGTWRRIKLYTFKMNFRRLDDPEYQHGNKFYYPENPDIQNWHKMPEYRNAYLSILTKWYAIYTKEYGRDLNKIKSPTIERETKDYRISQDKVSQFINSNIVKVGKIYPGTEIEVPAIPLATITTRYTQWMIKHEDPKFKMQQQTLIKMFAAAIDLKGFVQIKPGLKAHYLFQHKLLKDGETADQSKKPSDKEIKDYNEARDKREMNNIDDEQELDIKKPETKKQELDIKKPETKKQKIEVKKPETKKQKIEVKKPETKKQKIDIDSLNEINT